jgi:hypothetical protein
MAKILTHQKGKSVSCRLYPEETKLVKAHIFPKWMYEDLKAGSDHLLIVSSVGDRTKKSRIGLYDPNILSDRAEKHLGQYDSYGATFFRQSLISNHADKNLELQVFKNADFDYVKLKTFILSVLWRASISTMKELKAVDLGSHFEEKLRQNLLSPNSDIEPFSIVAFRYKPSREIINKEEIFGTPYSSRNEGQKWYHLRILDWRVSVKVDRKPVHKEADSFVLKPDNDFIVFIDDFDASSENMSISKLTKAFKTRRIRGLAAKS